MGVDFVGNTDKDMKIFIVDAEVEGLGEVDRSVSSRVILIIFDHC